MSYKGGNKATKNHLRHPIDYYTPHGILEAEVMTEVEARREYSRLRSIARKRLERFEGTEWVDTDVYKYNRTRYKPISEIGSYSELAHLLSDAAKFLSNDNHANSVSQLEHQRRQVIHTLHENGYRFINKGNFKQFTDFMDEVRARKLGHVRGSTPIVDMFQEAVKRNIDPEELLSEFSFWAENLEALKKQPRIKSDKPHDSQAYKQAILDKKANPRKQTTRKKK